MLHERLMSYLYEAGIQGGIWRAADILGINPSVIGRQIAQLERALELFLLERQGHNVALTGAGCLLAEDYHESRQRREKLESHLEDLHRTCGGIIFVRIGGGLMITLIESVMSTLSQSQPNAFVDISAGNMQEMLNGIASGEADMAVAFGPTGNPEFKRHSFQQGSICVVVSPQYPTARQLMVIIDELTQYRLIALTGSFGLQRHTNTIFKTAGRQFHPTYRCNFFSTVMSLSQAGLGISFMTEFAAREVITHGILKVVPIDHPIVSSAQCHLLHNLNHRFPPVAHHMWRLLHNVFRDAQRAMTV